MSSLTAAHRGYEYQDLLVACRFVDMLLGSVLHTDVDKKLVPDDRFDDLTTIGVLGERERTQFKHTENDDRPLTLNTFTTDSRGLRLDRVIAAMLADRDGPGCAAGALAFRIVLRDQAPIDPSLTAVLTPLESDPGPFLPSLRTVRLGFDAVALWSQREVGPGSAVQPFAFLFIGEAPLSFVSLKWACKHLVVEVGAPPASGDLTAPDLAERLLLMRVRAEVGAETFPNVDRAAVDVAAAMVSTARAARQGRLVVTAEELLRRTQLRSDFGAVSRAHPVDRALEVLRPTTVRQLVEAAGRLASKGGYLLVVGPPGHGKSWVCQQLLDALSAEGWLTAEHYCYLGDADGERLERVLAEAVFGSLIGRLAEADPRLITDHRPRFAADEEALVDCLRRSLNQEPSRRIALVIDGIDHITRVRARSGGAFDPSRSLAEALSSLDLPAESVVIVLTQPGSHLGPLEEAGAYAVTIPGLAEHELKLLAARLNVVPDNEREPSSCGTPLLDDAEVIAEFLTALAERSAGNALYATYLCRETLRRGDTQVDPVTAIRLLPPFDGSLKNYYDHLYQALGAEAGWVADIIALVDFSVTRAELREIRPDAAHHVDGALAVLGPVLIERATQGGVRVYHESFARYLRGPFQATAGVLTALLERVADWLEGKGFFADPRAFRSLLPILSEAGHDARVVHLVNQAFVTRAVAAGFPASGIESNLSTAIGSAARLSDWPAVVRYVELSRAADSYQDERFDSTLVAFADVPASLLGADTLAARLTDDDRLVMPSRAGLQMCAAVDALGATAPWRAYMAGYLREEKTDNTHYGEESDRAVALAWLRGRLRLATDPDIDPEGLSSQAESKLRGTDGDEANLERSLTRPVDWTDLAEWIEEDGLPAQEVTSAVIDTHGLNGVILLIRSLRSPGGVCLTLAERLASAPVSDNEICSPRLWAVAAVAYGTPAGSTHRLLKLGVDLTVLVHDPTKISREQLLNLTRRVQEPSARLESESESISAWLDACALAARRDPLGISTAEALIAGEGWYRCWLRFAIGLSRAEAAGSMERGSCALAALHYLTADLDPFSGEPRSCDLYSLHGVIQKTIGRAMDLLDDDQWRQGLDILKEVSASITTTLSGELGGPVPPDFLLELAVGGASPTRRGTAEALIADEIARGSARRYYADLARYRLLAARLALATSDRQRAEVLWQEACTFLTAYGWRKDATIYEVLDPLPPLIKADPARARARVAAVQSLCERVPLHTDKKGTREAWSRWWGLLAKADPVAAVHLAVPRLLAECDGLNWLLNDALEAVWRECHEHADPLLSGALRLTLDTPLDLADAKQLERLTKDSSAEAPAVRRLMTWLLARADERPVAYSYSNSDELIAKDDEKVAKLNKIAEASDLPPVVAIDDGATAFKPSRRNGLSSGPRLSVTAEDGLASAAFPPGLPGLTRAIRVWRSRPYDAQAPMWSAERFANVIGYRLIELVMEGRHEEAGTSLRLLAHGSVLGEQSGILRLIAEGLERYSEVRLAAVAYALAWTNTPGLGGWVRFGGESEIEALRQATELDPRIACAIVAEEIERVVASGYGTYGISRAVIYAFSVGALTSPGRPTLDVAFAAWDQAFAVIGARAPRVDASDDPDLPYQAPDLDIGEAAPGNLETALALAALGGLAHPSREKKRRAFLAAQILLDERAAIAAPAFKIALGAISDPATLTWLLRLIESADERSLPVRALCQEAFLSLVSRDLVTVRALARRLLSGEQPPLAPPTSAADELLGGSGSILWTPDLDAELSGEEPAGLDGLLEAVAGIRLEWGEQLLPGLRSAVRARIAKSLGDEAVKRRLKSQLDAFRDRLRERWPDAFLSHEQMLEETLQSVAAGGRAALLMTGNPTSNPIAWEDNLALALLDDPTVPLTLEAHRQPRPRLALPPGSNHESWRHVRERANGDSRSSVEEASESSGHFRATLSIEPVTSVPIVECGQFRGWRWLGTLEARSIKRSDWRRGEADLVAKRYRVLEVRDVADRRALLLPPVTTGDLRMWQAETDPALGVPLFERTQPLVGVDDELTMAGDGHRGLGLPSPLLVPAARLLALLNLHPGMPCTYEDRDGPGLALVIWRAEYDTSDYYLAWPRTCGSGIVIRPDLLARVVAAIGESRLVLRDFVLGDAELASVQSEAY